MACDNYVCNISSVAHLCQSNVFGNNTVFTNTHKLLYCRNTYIADRTVSMGLRDNI